MCVYRTGMMPPKYIYNIFKLITADLLTYFYTHPIYSLKSDFYYNFICFFFCVLVFGGLRNNN